MTASSDGRDIFFAGAGILWGTVTAFKGVQAWRETHKRGHGHAGSSARALHRVDFPPAILTGGLLALGCTAYLFWSLFLP